MAEGPKSVEYTIHVGFLSKELKALCSLDEHINAINGPEDSSSFLLEVSSFLKELGNNINHYVILSSNYLIMISLSFVHKMIGLLLPM